MQNPKIKIPDNLIQTCWEELLKHREQDEPIHFQSPTTLTFLPWKDTDDLPDDAILSYIEVTYNLDEPGFKHIVPDTLNYEEGINFLEKHNLIPS